MTESTITRRALLAALAKGMVAGGALGMVMPSVARADAAVPITVYKDPSCGCCTKWVDHLRASGLRPTVHDRTDMTALKDSLGVPEALRSCHTAVAGKYVIEGHVPAPDLKRLIASAPAGVVGLAVPDMPAGAPGMEMGSRRDRFDVIAFSARGTTSVFARH